MTNDYQPIQKLLEYLFRDFKIESHDNGDKFSVSIYDDTIKNAGRFLPDLEMVLRLIAKRGGCALLQVDINNYRKERERLIIELAKAAARKVVMTKQEMTLPPMNAYERRLVHMELASRPDVKTESVGEGLARKVIVSLV